MADLAEKQWYVATTYSGHEQKVADNIRRRVESMNLEGYVFRIVVAEEEIPVIGKDGQPAYVEKDGVKVPKVKIKNLYPGYVFVEMIMTDESWFMVRNTPGVTGITGSSGGGQKPTPVSPKEIETVLKRMGMVDNSMYENYHVGDLVKIIHGTFANVEGKIVSIDKENGAVKVDTIFFGRHTPVDVDFSEIVHVS
ncbi:MAG: transcription termination/antitermination protein NusG [Candidatus Onthovivens sp.]|nr:transcription termination/antitermination protein NusG [Mollicutes bacterium]MDY4857580.1 transcription termination/antitermination protein NusG [Candidatus Onthovivens sp.]MDY4936755.1 transcription termination/antitermination protein NusG [Candidatus Onthovivens sp.]